MKSRYLLIPILSLAAMPALNAAEVFRSIALNHLTAPDGSRVVLPERPGWRHRYLELHERVVVSEGEAVLEMSPLPWEPDVTRAMVVKLPEGGTLTGKLYLRGDAEGKSVGLVTLPFVVKATDGEPSDAAALAKARAARYQAWLDADIPGEGWFRLHRGTASANAGTQGNPGVSGRRGPSWRDVFTGNAAIRENLQLDRPLRLSADTGARTVAVDTLKGVTVKAFDWDQVIKPGEVALDPLAEAIPEDQHAVFFPSFAALLRVGDEAESRGTPLFNAAVTRAEDARTLARYRRQLCLDATDLARVFGPQLVGGVAVTGSDFYLPTGSDVGVVFASSQPAFLETVLKAKQAMAAKAVADAKPESGTHAGVAWTGVVTPDRALSAYIAVRGDRVFVSNSKAQLARLLDATTGAIPTLGASKEYRFFRQRYARGESGESAFMLISDATIRRWCGPRWRIAAERRAQSVAALAEAAARRLTDTKAPPAVSDEFGTAAFLTPILEAPVDKVTPEEARAYGAWRDSYERGWRAFFDPIAMRLSLTDKAYEADVTVMPLIASSDYREMISWTRGGEITAATGGSGANALLHYAMAIDPKSEPVARFGGEITGERRRAGDPTSMLDALKPNPLAWLGTALAVRVDNDPLFEELAKLPDEKSVQRHLMLNWSRLPVSLWVANRDSASLALFLTGLRGKIDSSAPGQFDWSAREHAGKPYVEIATKRRDGAGVAGEAQGGLGALRVYYAIGDEALFLTLSEKIMQAHLSGKPVAAKTVAAESGGNRWLGQHTAISVDRRLLDLAEGLAREPRLDAMREASWSVLPILNELHRIAPGRDPVALYAATWGATPRDPAGGAYVWNQRDATMESTVTGSPVSPKAFTPEPLALPGFSRGDFGLTFENDGLRARVKLTREVTK